MDGHETFDPKRYLIKISGRDYLEVKFRILWLRTEHPDAIVETELIRDDGSSATFKARVTRPSDGASATGWAQETAQDFAEYIERCETKALGRALAALGYGTQFCHDFDFGAAETGRVVDSPVALAAVRDEGVVRRPVQGDPATERQIKAIYAIGRAGHLSEADVAQRSQRQFGCPPDQLSRKDASALIDLLKDEVAAASLPGRAQP